MKLRDEGHTVDVRRMDRAFQSASAVMATACHGPTTCPCIPDSIDSVLHLQVRVTWEAEDVERFTKEALDAGVDTIVAAGKLSKFVASTSCACTCCTLIGRDVHNAICRR